MKKVLSLILTGLCLILLTGCEYALGPPSEQAEESPEADLSPAQEQDLLQALVLSDLHYTEGKGEAVSDVSGMPYAGQITDLIAEEVIEMHPDALILTGDNTGNGNRRDARALAEKLGKIREQGISIILTTGNHDFDGMDAGAFEEIYYPLTEPADRDPASLSYTSIVKGVVFLAMDDNALHPGGQGVFSQETMDWLRDMLKKYRDHPRIFLTHHNVLYGSREERASSNLIENEDLADLLREEGVRLILSGHMHFQYILEDRGLWEIISAMPLSGKHLIGHLTVGDRGAAYRAEPLDIEGHDPALGQALREMEEKSLAARRAVFADILEKEKVPASRREAVMDLILDFFDFFEEGTLADHAASLRSDPAYKTMIGALWDYNYGPWIRSMVEESRQSGLQLEIRW